MNIRSTEPMAVRRDAAWRRLLDAHNANRARRARLWQAAFSASLVAFLLALWAGLGLLMAGATDAGGWTLGAAMLAACCAAVAGEKGAQG